jgi:hypothetical protein
VGQSLTYKWHDKYEAVQQRTDMHILMGFRYLVEDLQFQESYLKSPKNYLSIKDEQSKLKTDYE